MVTPEAFMGSGWDDNDEPEPSGLSPEERKDVDERWRSDLTDSYDDIIKVIKSALQNPKKVRIERDCKKCGCSHIDFAEIENVDAAIKAAEFLSNRALGRPSQQREGEQEEKITFTRKVIYEGVKDEA